MKVVENVTFNTNKACRICCTLHVVCLNNTVKTALVKSQTMLIPKIGYSRHTHQLVIRYFRTILIKHEPPCRGRNSGSSNVDSNSHVPKEKPATDESFLSLAWRLHHNVYIRRVEAKCCSRGSICHKVHPQKLDWDECFWHSQGCSQEDATKTRNNDKPAFTLTVINSSTNRQYFLCALIGLFKIISSNYTRSWWYTSNANVLEFHFYSILYD